MALAFLWVYLTAAALLFVVFTLAGMAIESSTFAGACFGLAAIALTSNFLFSHSSSPLGRGIGSILWVGGLVVLGLHSVNGFILPPEARGTSPEVVLATLISIVAVLATFVVGRWWGPFYAALSFLVVPTLSIFGLIIPIIASFEMVIGFLLAFVLSLFLVSLESLLLRLQKGQVVQVTPSLLLNYCFRLATLGSALVLTIGLLLIPPATLLRVPLAQQLMRFRLIQPFVHYRGSGMVDFPELFTMPGGPINLPDTILYQVQGTTYPRWRVRTYVYYTGRGWRVSSETEMPQPIKINSRNEITELIVLNAPSSEETVTGTVFPTINRLTEFPVPGIPLRLSVPGNFSGFFVTHSGCVLTLRWIPVDRFNIKAYPIPTQLPPPDTDPPLDWRVRRATSQMPSYLWRIQDLARKVTAGVTDQYAQAKALEEFLRRHYKYTDMPPMVPANYTDVTSFFLFEAKEGACDWFASALTLMCRAVGIPARIVTGFYSDEVTDDGKLIIRACDAHAWVEAYIDEHGWITLDATPGGIRRGRGGLLSRVLGWFSYRRFYFLGPNVLWWFIITLWLLSLMPLAFRATRGLWYRYRPRPGWRIVVDCYLQAVRLGQRVGLPMESNATPWENAQKCAITPRFPVRGKNAFRTIADLTVSILYAQQEPNVTIIRQTKEALRQFRSAVRDYVRWFVRSEFNWKRLWAWWQRI